MQNKKDKDYAKINLLTKGDVKRQTSLITAGSARSSYRSPVHNSSGCFKYGKNWDRE